MGACAEDGRWVCISDPPPVPWVRKTAVGDAKRYLEARASERKRVEPPGYEPLEGQEEYRMAVLAASKGDPFTMRLHAERFAFRFPERPRASLMLGQAWEAAGNADRAVEFYRFAVALEWWKAQPLADSWRKKAEEWTGDESAEKEACLLKAERISKESSADAAEAWVRLASLHEEQGDLEAALAACNTGIKSFPAVDALHAARARIRKTMGDLDGAIAAESAGVRASPADPYPWYRLGVLLMIARQAREGIRCFEKSAELRPDAPFPWGMLGHAYVRRQDYAKAAEYCRKALSLDAEDSRTWNALSYCCTRLGLVEEAMDAGREAVRRRPDKNTWDTLGSAYSAAGRPQQATKCFLRTISLDWEHGEAWYNLGITYLRMGDRGKAVSVLAQLRRLDLAWTALLLDELAD